jgi:hypothetical protein
MHYNYALFPIIGLRIQGVYYFYHSNTEIVGSNPTQSLNTGPGRTEMESGSVTNMGPQSHCENHVNKRMYLTNVLKIRFSLVYPTRN